MAYVCPKCGNRERFVDKERRLFEIEIDANGTIMEPGKLLHAEPTDDPPKCKECGTDAEDRPATFGDADERMERMHDPAYIHELTHFSDEDSA